MVFWKQDPTEKKRQRESLADDGDENWLVNQVREQPGQTMLVRTCQQSISEKNKLRRYPKYWNILQENL